MEEKRKNLNEEDILKIKKKAKKKVIKHALVVGLIFDAIVIRYILKLDINAITKSIYLEIMQVLIILSCVTISWLRYQIIVSEEQRKLRKAFTEACLSKNAWTKVLPVMTDRHQEFIFNELPKRAELFAKLQEDSDVIDVSIKFYDEDKYIPFEKINKSSFLNYYLIL